MKLTLVRHTSLQIGAGVCYGQSDVDVAESFINEALITQTTLAIIVFDAVYTSPQQRCVKLAEALNLGEPVLDNRLMELNFGEWELRAWDSISRDIFDAWGHDYANLAPPKGETFSQLQQRGLSFLEEILAQHPNEHIVAISLGGMIRALLAHALNMPLKGLFRFTIDYGSVTQLDFGNALPKIEFVNL